MKPKHKSKKQAENKLKQYLNDNQHNKNNNEKTTTWEEKDK